MVLPACPEPVTEGWEPAMEDEVRLDLESATWTDVEPGGKEATFAYERGEDYQLTMTVEGDVTVVEHLSTGDARVLATASGPDIDLLLQPDGVGEAVGIEVEDDAVVSALQVTGTNWAAGGEPGDGLLHFGVLIHIEADAQFVNEPERWSRRARVIDGLAEVFTAHGAVLNVQPDVGFVRGAPLWDEGWIDEIDVTWSAHLHGEEGDAETLESAARDARRGFKDVGIQLYDVNGGFQQAAWSTFADIGFSSLTAFKDPATQSDLPLAYASPWRPADGAGTADPDAFAEHDPDGPMVYLPGLTRRESDHARFPAFASRVLSQFREHVREEFVNTLYLVLHVDGFGPGGGRPETDAYLDDGSFEADLAWYDAFLGDVTDPLVAEGALVYSEPDEMREAWLRWESACQ